MILSGFVRWPRLCSPYLVVFRRRQLLYFLPGVLVVVLVTLVNGGFELSSVLNAALVIVLLGGFVALITTTRTATRRTGSQSVSLQDIGLSTGGGWSWQAMTRRGVAGPSGEQLAEIVWDGREFCVDSTRERDGVPDVLAYCVDVVMQENAEACIARIGTLPAKTSSWSVAERESCRHTVEGFLPSVDPLLAGTHVRVRVDAIDPVSARVRVVLTPGPIPVGVRAAVNRYLAKEDPLVGLPRTARAVVSALGLDARYEGADIPSDPLGGALVGLRSQGEFGDSTLFVHRERLAVSGTSGGSRILVLLLIIVGVFIGVPLLGVMLSLLLG